jgi:hypothetical protein
VITLISFFLEYYFDKLKRVRIAADMYFSYKI